MAATETRTERLARLRAAWANPQPVQPVSATEAYQRWAATNPHPRDAETTDRLFAAMKAERDAYPFNAEQAA
jgi:hypothetical protein